MNHMILSIPLFFFFCWIRVQSFISTSIAFPLLSTKSEVAKFSSVEKDIVVINPRSDKIWFDSICQQADPPNDLKSYSRNGQILLSEVELPNTRQEPYRYSKLRELYSRSYDQTKVLPVDKEFIQQYFSSECDGQRLVFINGKLDRSFSDTSNLSPNIQIGSALDANVSAEQKYAVMETLELIPEINADMNTCQGSLPFAALNQACFTDVSYIYVPENVEVNGNIQIIFFSSSPSGSKRGEVAGNVNHPRLVIIARRNSKLSVLQTFAGSGSYFCNGLSHVLVEQGAEVRHFHSQEQSSDSHHVDTLCIDLQSGSSYSLGMIASGGLTSRTNVQVELLQEGSNCQINTLSLCADNQLVDVHTTLGHACENAKSKQYQRNIVTDTAECVFKGRIRVDGVAMKTEANQLCRTLMLSDTSRATIMPSLEIIADDVICTHGATVSDIDEESLFYLNSRGISFKEARQLIIKSFAHDMMTSFPDAKLKVDEISGGVSIRMIRPLFVRTKKIYQELSLFVRGYKGKSVEIFYPPEELEKHLNRRTPILFLPWECRGREHWFKHMEVLSQKGITCASFDFNEGGLNSNEEQVSSIVETFENPPLLVGRSIGSFVAQRYAAIHGVGGLILIDPYPPDPVEMAVELAAFAFNCKSKEVKTMIDSNFEGCTKILTEFFSAAIWQETTVRVERDRRFPLKLFREMMEPKAVLNTKLNSIDLLVISTDMTYLAHPEIAMEISNDHGGAVSWVKGDNQLISGISQWYHQYLT